MFIKSLYEGFSNKIANLIGFDETDIERFESYKKSLFEDSANGSDALRNYFSYRYFDNKSQNFLLDSSCAGFLLRISPLVGINDLVVKNLNQFFTNELPNNGYLQFFLIASSDIDDFLDFWKLGRNTENKVLQRMTRERSNYLHNMASNFSSSGKCLPRSFKFYVSYSKNCKNTNEIALEEISYFQKNLISKLSSLHLNPRICDSDDLVRLCRDIFEFNLDGRKVNYKPISKFDTLNNQCLSCGNHYRVEIDKFMNITTDIAHRAYTISSTPDFWSLLQNINLLGNSERSPLPARFCISYSISNEHKTKKGFIARGKRVIDSAERPYSRHNKALIEEAMEWREIIHRLNIDDSVLNESWILLISCKTKDLDGACNEFMTQYGGHDWNLSRLDYFHLEAILGMLPMHASNFWNELKSKKLVQPALSSEVVAKLPIHGEWEGVPLSGVPLIGKRGQLFNWNPYHRLASGNFNINVIGPSGVGKSVFLQCLADSMLAQGVRIFVIDIGASYASLAKLLGGEIIEFGSKSTFTINPFSGLLSGMEDEEFNQLVLCARELLAIMCGANGEFELASLEEAIKEALINNDYNLDIDGFVEFLKQSNKESLCKFSTSLYSYTPKGVFGKYFSGEKSAKFDKAITIFEFENIKGQDKLIAIILQTLLMQITSQFLTGDRSQKFMLIVDEAYLILDFSAGFLSTIARNLRRYGGSLVVCTQCFADLQTAGKTIENNNQRQSIFENSSWKINLPPSTFGGFEVHSDFKDKIPLLKSLSFQRGKYSEMLLSSSGIDVIGRLMLDPFSATIFSTESDDFNFLKKQEEEGVSMEDAIDKLIEVRKNGK